jgi:hypothetical protein
VHVAKARGHIVKGEADSSDSRPTVAVPAATAATRIVTDADAGAPDTGAIVDVSELLLGRYRLGRRLGSGAFGTVFQAKDERLDRTVAIKVIPRSLVVSARFEREARAAARLQHPGIVLLYEAAVDDDGAYLVSELVHGKTLQRLLADGELSDREILEIGVTLCDALAHAHAEGVIHRDVKPSNVLVPRRRADPAGAAKLTDFSVAELIGSETLTRTGDVIGTEAYMAPEQAAGGEVGPAADLYSLALVLYEALSGVNPRTEALRLGRASATVTVTPLQRQRRDLEHGLTLALDRALARVPSQRGTLTELREVLAAAIPESADVRGVVAPGWGGTETETTPLAELGNEWSAVPTAAAPSRDRRRRERLAGVPVGEMPLPRWLPRALAALAAGLAGGFCSAHLLSHPPLAALTAGLITALVTLVLPRAGWTAVILALALLAAIGGHGSGALALLLIALPPLALLSLVPAVAALPAGAAALGAIGLAGAWPALAAWLGRSWWQRAVLAASGYIWLVAASILWGRTLYWRPAGLASGSGWTADAHVALHQVLIPLVHSRGLAGALVWAIVAVVLPFLHTRRWPLADIVLAVIAAVVTVLAVGAVGAADLHGAVLGAAVAALITAAPALVALTSRRMGRPESGAAVS